MTDNANLEAMQDAVSRMKEGTQVFDVTIICTTDDYQADYWMDRLQSGLLATKKKDGFPLVLAVSEDWSESGGAGNGLGTLYAWTKACKLAQAKNIDLNQGLLDGTLSAALYHTAGKGTRLAPLPASENNNKPGVKLPFPLQTEDGSMIPLTVLEAVVKQTGLYARKGRLAVFWGDQVFLPTAPIPTASTHHVDILCTLLPQVPTADTWKEQGLDKYGVIAVMDNQEAAQVEKVSHETATRMLSGLGNLQQVGPSLGSFSVSATMLKALVSEYGTELDSKKGKLDTDPHFWMPLTLPKESYIELMQQKGTGADESTKHFERMAAFKAKFKEAQKDDSLALFGAVNVGKGACWWDYGQLKLYSKNTKLLHDKTQEADLLRAFLGVSSPVMASAAGEAKVSDDSYVFCSKVNNGSITSSLVCGVTCHEIDATGAILVNCVAKMIVAGEGSIGYNLVCEGDVLEIKAGEVKVAVTKEAGNSFDLCSRMDVDGGKAWKTIVVPNKQTFEQVNIANRNANIGEIAKKRQEHYDKVSKSIGF